MKKKYLEPKMIVEDFKLSEMVAAKCTFNTANLFTSQMTAKPGPCLKSQKEANKNGTSQEWNLVSALFDEGADFDNADNDNNWISNYEVNQKDKASTDVFTAAFRTKSQCTYDVDEHGVTFMNYTNHYSVTVNPCTADSGNALLQNS